MNTTSPIVGRSQSKGVNYDEPLRSASTLNKKSYVTDVVNDIESQLQRYNELVQSLQNRLDQILPPDSPMAGCEGTSKQGTVQSHLVERLLNLYAFVTQSNSNLVRILDRIEL